MRNIIIITVLSFLTGVGVCLLVLRLNTNEILCKSNYRYINSNLNCLPKYSIKKHEYIEFKDRLVSYIESEKERGHADIVSVYFRDLYNGPTFGYEESETFSPASLLKLPLMITYLRISEDLKLILDRTIEYYKANKTDEKNQVFPPEKTLEDGKKYKIEDLIKSMIVYSNNDAYFLLFNYLINNFDENVLLNSYHELGLVHPRNDLDETISTKAYASIFRLLYQSSYLSIENSEKALKMLSETTFKQGLAAGVPSNIKIAHKFGERENNLNKQNQLHDCGIVYYPNNPYLLCIMTQGSNFVHLEAIISEISKITYQEVDSRKIRD